MDFAGELSPYKLFMTVDAQGRSIRFSRTTREMQLEIALHYMQGESDEPHCFLATQKQFRIPDNVADAPALTKQEKELGVIVVTESMYPKADYLAAIPFLHQPVLTGWMEAVALMKKYTQERWLEMADEYAEHIEELEGSMKGDQE